MDDLPPDLESLFTQEEHNYIEEQALAESVDPESLVRFSNGMVRCNCGKLVTLTIPTECECGKRFAYWQDIQGKTKSLAQMDLGHLNNCVRMLAAKAEKYPPELRGRFEVALDIFYAEIGSRDKEIAQATGILAAVMRGVARSKAEKDE